MAMSKTHRYIADTMFNWRITDPNAILPPDYSPRELLAFGSQATFADLLRRPGTIGTMDALAWSKTFAEALKTLSGISIGRHGEVVQLLVDMVSERRMQRGDDAVAEIVTADLKRAVERWEGMERERLELFALASAAAGEMRRVERENAVFVGGLMEGLPREEDGGAAVTGGGSGSGFFTIPILDSARQTGAGDAEYMEREL
ncbi:hypothetical protein HBI82_015190 [Parastagonospora nodorum]|nr:hypothetical protein HBI06_037090 [Parastagonospora nodorum]KAH4238936.1 hypothetical protein HBI05_120070 [Parastagonospora nodorum]KAH4861555.1 hypothetical protein HBH75_028480 [Parastagonospora nodorum]KAH5036727.1 hypothetical protein HBI74_054940 [Parastagonospora nodorum]KAH5369268.1 hypothetical protein HBI48_043190 [Parastagonospora nodorum]